MRPRNIVFAIVLGAALAAGIFLAARFSPEQVETEFATVLPAAGEIPAFSLVNQAGVDVDETVFEGQWDLVFFGFTHCPDICPLTLQKLQAARLALSERGFEPLPRIVLVSVDPERDTPARLAGYVQNFGDGNLALTGEIDELRALTSALGIYFNKVNTDSEYYSVDHSSVVLVIDPEARYRALFSAPHDADHFVRDLPVLVGL